MKMPRIATVAAVVFAFAAGCQPVVVTTPAKEDKEKGVHINTPGANVDIEGKKGDRKVDVEVPRKDAPR
jgi:hypothetical protein